jgi:hypothetical protein
MMMSYPGPHANEQPFDPNRPVPQPPPGWSPPPAGYQPPVVPGQPVPYGHPGFPPPVAPPKKNTGKIVLAVVGGLVGLCCVGAVAAATRDGATKDAAVTNAVTTTEATKQSTAEPAVDAVTEPPAEATTKATKATKKLTVSQENAVEKAAGYLDYTAFSRSGLIKQLKFEGFTAAQATYGAKKAGL